MAHITNNPLITSPDHYWQTPVDLHSPMPVSQHEWICLDQPKLYHPHAPVLNALTMVKTLGNFLLRRFNINVMEDERIKIYYDHKKNNTEWVSAGDWHCVLPVGSKFPKKDVITHVFMHELIRHCWPFDLYGQPEALNESLCDIFTIIFRHYREPNTDDWKLGDRDLAAKVPSDSVIDAFWIEGKENDASVKISNHAFYLAVKISHTRADGVMADIWFDSMMDTDRPSDESIYRFALRTLSWSKKKSSANEFEAMRITAAVGHAWAQVGVLKYELNAGINLSPPLPSPFSWEKQGGIKYDFAVYGREDGTYAISLNIFQYLKASHVKLASSPSFVVGKWQLIDMNVGIMLQNSLGKIISLYPSSLLKRLPLRIALKCTDMLSREVF